MSRRKLDSDYQQPENQGRHTRSRQTPLACIVCDKVFLDNASLVMHIECHLRGENLITGQHNGYLASLQSRSPLSLSFSPSSSSVERTNEARSPRVNNCFRPSPLPVSSAPTDANFSVLNSMPPLSSSFGARSNVPQPIHFPVMSGISLCGSSSTSTHPLAYGPTAAPLLHLPEQNAGQARFPNHRIPHNNEHKRTDLIVSSDSYEEEEEKEEEKDEEAIDLSLRL